jgi:dienelactone hydrolase
VKFLCLALAVLTAVLVAFVYPRGQSASAGSPQAPLYRQDWLIPSTVSGVPMHTEIIPPHSTAPFPLAVINHGSISEAELRKGVPLTKYEYIASWFVNQRYLVALPQRLGHGDTGGPYLEDIVSCDEPDYVKAGLGAAASITATVEYLTRQPFVRKTGVVLIGHSAGAWGALAAASQMPVVRAVINFAGGLGGRSYGQANRNCAPDRLVQAAAELGRITRVPTLWLYAANDSYFDAALSERMAAAFRGAGGLAEYHLLPSFDDDGHFLMFSSNAVGLWAPLVEKFLRPPPR